MRLSDYVANFIADLGIRHTHGVVGGGAMWLNDSFGNHERMQFIAYHHEQGAAFAADAYARLHGLACCCVTTGPGGSNAITGVLSSWIDSIPVIYISGQVPTTNLMTGRYTLQYADDHTGVRQLGVQESDIVDMVTAITKFAVTVTDEKSIRCVLEMAVHLATTGRKGPVWIDIPLDIQSKQIEPAELKGFFSPTYLPAFPDLPAKVTECLTLLRSSKRPVLIVGNGVRLAGATEELRALADALGVPIVSSWLGADMIADHPNHIGHCGLFGDRASNFAVQTADLLLVIGCRLSVPQIGYDFAAFARNAKIIMVDIDEREIKKPTLHVDLGIVADAKAFIREVLARGSSIEINLHGSPVVNYKLPWLNLCQGWRAKYPVVLTEYENESNGINSFTFAAMLADKLPDDAIVVLGTGTAFTCVYQTAKMKRGQRWISNAGNSAMGWALPAAIGAAFATGKKIVCIVGDGDLQFNIQELATISHHRLPITIFVLNNGGYLTIKAMQKNHFGRLVGSDETSGVSFPDLRELARAYDIRYCRCETLAGLVFDVHHQVIVEKMKPTIIEVMMPPNQPLIPRVASRKLPDGSVVSTEISDMVPHLPREEYEAAMKVGE